MKLQKTGTYRIQQRFISTVQDARWENERYHIHFLTIMD